MYLETPRMILRDFTPEDADDLFAILGDGETMKYFQGSYTRAQTQEFLEDFCIARHGAVAGVLKETGHAAAYLLFHELEPEVYEIGWAFHKDHWHRGLAYESCYALMDFAFRQGNAHRIFAETIDSVKSAGLMKKLGMVPEGIQRQQVRDADGAWADLHLYGILRDEWLARNK